MKWKLTTLMLFEAILDSVDYNSLQKFDYLKSVIIKYLKCECGRDIKDCIKPFCTE